MFVSIPDFPILSYRGSRKLETSYKIQDDLRKGCLWSKVHNEERKEEEIGSLLFIQL